MINKTCKICGDSLSGMRSGALYCSKACSQKAKRVKVKKTCMNPTCKNILSKQQKRFCSVVCRKAETASRKVDLFSQTRFGLYLIKEVQKAKTVEILDDLREHSELESLFTLYKRRSKYSGYRRRAEYHLCHLYPVNGNCGVGLLSSRNLVIGMAAANFSLKDEETSGLGCFIPHKSLKQELKVKEESKVFELIKFYLGSALSEFCAKHQLAKVRGSRSKEKDIEHPMNVLREEVDRIGSDTRYSTWFREMVVSELNGYSSENWYSSETWTDFKTNVEWFPWDRENFDYEEYLRLKTSYEGEEENTIESDVLESFRIILQGGHQFDST